MQSRVGDEWHIKSSQTLANGDAASGTYVMTPIDENTMTVQLIGHEIEGEPQPATPAITVIRAGGRAAAKAPTTDPAAAQNASEGGQK